jgi:hypothetical protein
MRTYGVSKREDAYEVFGVAKEDGAVVVVRPDGYVGLRTGLGGAEEEVRGYFGGCLRPGPVPSPSLSPSKSLVPAAAAERAHGL